MGKGRDGKEMNWRERIGHDKRERRERKNEYHTIYRIVLFGQACRQKEVENGYQITFMRQTINQS